MPDRFCVRRCLLNAFLDALVDLVQAQHEHEALDGFVEIGPKVMREIAMRFGEAEQVITAV